MNPTTGSNNICRGNTTQLTNTTTSGVWASSANNVATVSNSGLVTGVASSNSPVNISYTVTSTAGCSNTANFSLTVSAYAPVPNIAYAAGTSNPQVGANSGFCRGRIFTVVGSPASGTWSSSNNSKMTVNSSGLINLLDTGTVTLTYTVTNATGCSSSRSITGKIVNCPGSRGISMSDIMNETDFAFYPNPAKTFVSLNIETLIGWGNMIITDLYGKQVKQQTLGLGENRIDVSSLKKGYYMVSITTNTGTKTKSLIVE